MEQKVKIAIELAKLGIKTEIISGKKQGNLKKALLGEKIGTLITW